MSNYSRLSTEVGEGNAKSYNSLRSRIILPNLENINLPPVFRRYVVLDTISSPVLLDKTNLGKLQDLHGPLSNIEHAIRSIVPRNSIIAKQVYSSNDQNKLNASQPVILYPFFPSHLALPCKPGEHVWVMFESITEIKTLGYWFCRIVGPDHIDDVNHSHAPREHDDSFSLLSEEIKTTFAEAGIESVNTKPRYYFKNGIFKYFPVDDGSGTLVPEERIDPSTFTLLSLPIDPDSGTPEETAETPENGENATPQLTGDKKIDENAYENILTNKQNFYQNTSQTIREPVPRYKKNPGDLAIEGSNNTLIALGIDKNMPGPSAGAIDLVVGRGTTPRTMGAIAENVIGFVGATQPEEGQVQTIKGKELDKHPSKLALEEGSSDYVSDRSRILIAQRTRPDTSFGLNGYNSRFEYVNSSFRQPRVEDAADGDAAIVIKTDKVRIIARSDIQLIVTPGGDGTNALGERVNLESGNLAQWASITIKKNGDIIFTPSSDGYIKLGGDDADKGIVCSAVPVGKVGGGVVGDAIQNTAGGRLAGSSSANSAGNVPLISPKHGTYANKVLVK